MAPPSRVTVGWELKAIKIGDLATSTSDSSHANRDYTVTLQCNQRAVRLMAGRQKAAKA